MNDKISSILDHASSQGYRTNAVKCILGGMICSGVGLITSLFFEDKIVTWTLLGLTVFFGIIYTIVCVIFLFKNPDILRSEKYNLEKTAIEKVAMIGDSNYKSHIRLPEHEYTIVESINSEPKKINLAEYSTVTSNEPEINK